MDNIISPGTSVEERIFQIVAEEAEQPRQLLDRDTALADHLDSLGKVELVMALEDEFELAIPDDESEKIVTVGELIDAIAARLGQPRESTPDGRDAPASH